MSSSTQLIGLEMFSAPSQSDRCKPQADLLVCLRNDNFEGFEYILTNCGKWIDINHLYEGPDNKTLLDIACSCKKKAKFVERLLAGGAIVNSLNKLHGKAPIHLAVLYSDFDTLKLLVQNPGIDINFYDKEGNTVLHYAVQLDDREIISLLLDNGAHIGVPNSNGDLPVKFMSAATLENLLDHSLSTKGQLLEKDYQIIFDYGLLVCKKRNPDSTPVEETELLEAMSRVPELGPLLKHPVLTSFLDLKWQNVTSGLYWRMLFIHALFSITLTAYVLQTYVPLTMLKEFGNEMTRHNGTIQSDAEDELKSRGYWWQMLALACISIILFRELLQLLFYSKCRYFKDFESYLKIALIYVTYVTLTCIIQDEKCRYRFAAVMIFLSYIELMLLISHHPVVSISVYQFKKMIRSYTKLMTWYAAFVLAFAVSFYILYTERNVNSYSKYSFSNVTSNIMRLAFKTPDLFENEFDINYFLLAIYYFFVTVTLFSLLNVVAMTNALTINAELVKFVSQANFIINVERSAPDLISLLGAVTDWYQLLIERRLKRLKKRSKDSKRSAASCLPATAERKVYVFVNQKNRIVAKNMKFRDEDMDESSFCCCAKTWSFSKSSIEDAKKILGQRSDQQKSCGGDKGNEDVAQAVTKLQNRLAALERALKSSEQKQQNVVEEAVMKFESMMKMIEDRLQKAVDGSSTRTIAEIRKLVGEIVPQARTDADYFYST